MPRQVYRFRSYLSVHPGGGLTLDCWSEHLRSYSIVVYIAFYSTFQDKAMQTATVFEDSRLVRYQLEKSILCLVR